MNLLFLTIIPIFNSFLTSAHSISRAEYMAKKLKGYKTSKTSTKGKGEIVKQDACLDELYNVIVDAIEDKLDIYNIDGGLQHADGSGAGYFAVACTKSTFLMEVLDMEAGTCVTEIYFVEDDGTEVGTVTGAATAVFDDKGLYTDFTITGGIGCALGADGIIVARADTWGLEYNYAG